MSVFSKRLFIKSLSYAVAASAFICMSASSGYAQDKGAPVDLQADRLVHDDNGQTVTALGDVVLIQSGRTVKADKIVYNLKQDTVSADGNVVFTDTNGDQHYADHVDFDNALKDGFVEGLKTFLVDGSRFTASNGKYISGNKTIMKDAHYTPCEPCKNDPEAPPLWQIRASEVEHDKEEKTVSYRNARFEISGVPIAYMPYFEHPDGTVKRKSGFLTPSAGFTSELGAFVESSYYWSIAPDKDMTAGMRVMTDAAPMGMLEWRQRWENASLVSKGTFTYSSRNDRQAGMNISQGKEFRGSMKVDGIWDINNKWRAGTKLDFASDDQYLRQYDLDSTDVLHNELYLERFSGRNYAAGRLLAFQDLRIDEYREDQPHVLPEIETSFLGEPDSVPLIGGRWSFDTSLLGLVRDNDEQDVNRIHGAVGWKRKMVSDYGLVTVMDAKARASFYDVNDRTGSQSNPLINGNSQETRTFGYINAQTSYPVSKYLENSQWVIEPIASVTAAPNIGNENEIPNEDSQDVQIDALNLFEPNRFPGIDGTEDGSHMTYGLRTGLFAFDGSYGEVFLGQSYRFDESNNPFVQGSGLDTQASDIVGSVSARYKDDYSVDYRFQLDDENLTSQRHEVDMTANVYNLTFNSRYLYAKGLEGTDITETREQITNSAHYKINDTWSVSGSARHDLGYDSGLRSAGVGIDYFGQCISLSLIGQRSLTDESSGDSGTEVFLRIGFKNLGEIQTSGFQLGGSDQ